MNYQLWNKDFLLGVKKIEDNSIDLIVTDPPYCFGIRLFSQNLHQNNIFEI